MMVWTIVSILSRCHTDTQLVFALAFSMTVPAILAGRFLIGFFEATFVSNSGGETVYSVKV